MLLFLHRVRLSISSPPGSSGWASAQDISGGEARASSPKRAPTPSQTLCQVPDTQHPTERTPRPLKATLSLFPLPEGLAVVQRCQGRRPGHPVASG